MPFLAAIPIGVVVAASIATTVAAASVSAAVAIQQAQAQKQAADFNAQVGANNAQVTAWQRQQQEQEYARQGQLIAQQGADQASSMEQRNRAEQASHINNLLAAGVTISGSSLDAVKGAAVNNDLDVLNQQYSTQLQVYANQNRANDASYNNLIQQRNQSAGSMLSTQQGANAVSTGDLSATGSILGGLSNAAAQGNKGFNQGPDFGGIGNNQSVFA